MKGAAAGWVRGLIAFLAPGAAVVGAAVLVSSPGGDRVTTGEWITAAVAALVTSAAVDARVARRVSEDRARGQNRDPRA